LEPGIMLGRIAIGDWLTALIGLANLVAIARWKVNNPLLIAIASIIGLVGFAPVKPTSVFVK
jgi:chromate transporter